MKINYGRQYIDKADIKAVSQALSNELITTGENVKKFEKKLVNFFQSKYVISCNSGTSAILMSLLALNLRKNSNVVIPSVNFIAAANLCKNFGYNIFFSDIDPSTGQITPYYVDKCINQNKIKKVDLIFTMHLGGNPENVLEFYKLKKKLKCFLIEDACHSLGASYFIGKKKFLVGNAKHTDITTFSFHPLKTITTGEGGAIATNNKNFANEIFLLRSHGITNKKDLNYDVKLSGYNFRLSDINCALGISQLKKIKKIVNLRRKIFKFYLDNLNGYKDVIEIINDKYRNSSCHLVIAKINFSKLKINKSHFYKQLKKKGIICQYHYIPQYHFSFYKSKKRLKNTELYYKNCISLPIHLLINERKLNYIIKEIKKILKKNLLS